MILLAKRSVLIGISLLCAALLLPASLAQAEAQVEVKTRTLMLAQGTQPGVDTAFPFYQWLEVSGRDLATPGLSAHASLWGFGALDSGGLDLASDGRVAGDLNLLYAQYRDAKGRYELRLGRQLALGGAGSGFFGHIDGAFARASLNGLEAQGFAGRVVESRFSNLSQADWLAGGRVGYRRWGLFNLGLSFLQARNDKRIARQLASFDAALALNHGFDATLAATADLMQLGLAEASVSIRYLGTGGLSLGLRLQQQSPNRLLDQSSIFSVFSLGDYAEGGLFLEYRVNPQWVLGAQYAAVFFPGESGYGFSATPGHRAQASVTSYLRRDLWLRLSVDRLPTADNGYSAARVALRFKPKSAFSGSAEFLAYFYDKAPMTRSDARQESLLGRLFADYRLHQGLTLGLGAELGEGVLTTLDARLLLRLSWATAFGAGGTS